MPLCYLHTLRPSLLLIPSINDSWLEVVIIGFFGCFRAFHRHPRQELSGNRQILRKLLKKAESAVNTLSVKTLAFTQTF